MNRMWSIAAGTYRQSSGILGKYLGFGSHQRSRVLSTYSQTTWPMCALKSRDDVFLKGKPVTGFSQCRCSGLLHTKGEKSLVDFLKTEIVEERKTQKMQSLPAELNGFKIEADGAELNFVKKTGNETVLVNMNVNNSFAVDDEEGQDGYVDEMKSKPSFEVDIVRNNQTLNFCCSYVHYGGTEEKGDVYQIDEVALFEGEWNDKNYSVEGDILDENLYDLFMTLLFEKGITNEFMEEVSDIATFYEHSKYISLLEGIQKFSSNN